MWTKEILGTNIYHLIFAFIIYSMLGWLVESIYMSFCNRKLTNRGFAKSPFCPIYGVGGVVGYLLLHPLEQEPIKLYLAGAILATLFEFLVGKMMLKLFGSLWWDYHDKPCNYKGIICLESTIAWGFYAIIIITFLHSRIIAFIEGWNMLAGKTVCCLILLIVTIDYIIQIIRVLEIDVKEKREKLRDRYQSFKARWY